MGGITSFSGKTFFLCLAAGLFNTFLIFGLIFLVTIIGGAFFLKIRSLVISRLAGIRLRK